MRRSLTVTSLLCLSLVLTACGGEGDSDESTSLNDSPSTSASSPAETDDSDDDASETEDDASETAEPTPSGDADGATAPFAGALLAEGEEAEESLKGTVQGAPQWMTFTDDGVNSAELAARCTGKGELKLQPLVEDLDSARPGKPQLLALQRRAARRDAAGRQALLVRPDRRDLPAHHLRGRRHRERLSGIQSD